MVDPFVVLAQDGFASKPLAYPAAAPILTAFVYHKIYINQPIIEIIFLRTL